MDYENWVRWAAVTLVAEAVIVWYIYKSKSEGVIKDRRWFRKKKVHMVRAANQKGFDSMIKLYWFLASIAPFMTYFIVFRAE